MQTLKEKETVEDLSKINVVWDALPENPMLTLYSDISTPLILDAQVFWFDKIISEFLDSLGYFESSDGLMITIYDGFTYEPIKAGKNKIPYLFGFYSNESSECYTRLSTLCDSDKEKEYLRDIVATALNELLQAALDKYGSADLFRRLGISDSKWRNNPPRSLRISVSTAKVW